MLVAEFIILGIVVGILAGMVGVGGGIMLIPALVYFFHFSQKTAIGTTLALMIPPIGIFAAWSYYKADAVNIKAALFIALGFMVGSFLSAHLASQTDDKVLTKIFGVFLLAASIKMLFFSR